VVISPRQAGFSRDQGICLSAGKGILTNQNRAVAQSRKCTLPCSTQRYRVRGETTAALAASSIVSILTSQLQAGQRSVTGLGPPWVRVSSRRWDRDLYAPPQSHDPSNSGISVGSKLKCPVFVASEMSGFKVVPSPDWVGLVLGMGLQGRGRRFPFPCSALQKPVQ